MRFCKTLTDINKLVSFVLESDRFALSSMIKGIRYLTPCKCI